MSGAVHIYPSWDAEVIDAKRTTAGDCKIIVHGASRNECLMRLRRAREECVIGGIETTIPLLERIVVAPNFVSGAYDIRWLEQFAEATR